ncbi:MAG: hypothetical protein PHE47_06430 [Oscillospiraceae bacterium]|nr:hypothetical protein [Oscillospiraceae bacterium]
MEFSIQKLKRCGKSALQLHRRAAARVVFFTFFLPPSLLFLLGAFLRGAPHRMEVRVLGDIERIPALPIEIAVMAAVLLLFYLPMWMGAKHWYLSSCRSEALRTPSMWFYFSSFRLYRKAVWAGLSLVFLRSAFLLLCLMPAGAGAVAAAVFYRRAGSDLGRSLSLLCLMAAVGLLFCGIAAARYHAGRYFWVPWLLANDWSSPVRLLFSESASLTRRHGWQLRKIRRSLTGLRALSLGMLPAFWSVPAVEYTMAIWVAGRLTGKRERAALPFRQRQVKRVRLSKSVLPAQ